MLNDYTGFHPPKDWRLPRIKANDPKIKDYIKSRTPFITTMKGYDWLSLENLSNCGVVQVEHSVNNTFGNGGTRKMMKFADFIKELPKGKLYLTTQYQSSIDETGSDVEQDSILKLFAAPPLDEIIQQVPIDLDIFHGLVLHQMNLWIGHSENGASSGLHHDFHDNFYMLRKGQKKFRIFSPKDAESMYLNGEVKRIHQNGLIEYHGDSIRSDGAYVRDVLDWKIGKYEQMIDNAEDETERDAAENALNLVLDELLQHQTSQGIEDDDFDESEDFGDFNATDGETKFNHSEISDDIETQTTKKLKTDHNSPPPSFSQVPIKNLRDRDFKDYPRLEKATMIQFELAEDDMLYLPAGWFHEVTSLGGTHIAMNYWLCPPTADKTGKLYEDDFWKETWYNRVLDEIRDLKL